MKYTNTLLVFLVLSALAYPAIIKVPENYTKIQSAINVAHNGDTVLVAPGTYQENINFIGKAITVKSSDGPAVTTINGNGKTKSTVTFWSKEDPNSVLDGFTITLGWGTSIAPYTYGGGIYCDLSSPTIQNCIIRDNHDVDIGGGIFCSSSSPIIVNTAIAKNSATGYDYGAGGGIAFLHDCAPIITNCSFIENSATVEGAGIWCFNKVTATVTNSLFGNNTASSAIDIWMGTDSYPGSLTISYCNIDQNEMYVMPGCILEVGSGMISGSPKILSITNNDFRLSSKSPCIDVGDNNAPEILSTDFENDDRIVDGLDNGDEIADIGFDEFLPLYVPEYYQSIQKAIGASLNNDEVIVTPGVYYEQIDFMGKSITVRSDADGDPGSDDIAAGVTIIDGNQAGPVVTFVNGENSTAVLNGFTIRNGNNKNAGGILCDNKSSPTISNCFIKDNSASDGGGGIGLYQKSAPIIQNCLIMNNSATGAVGMGGGILCNNNSTQTTIKHCTISENSATSIGGGLSCRSSSSPKVTDTILWGNTANTDPDLNMYLSNPIFNYCCVKGGAPAGGNNNIKKDPLFIIAGPEGNFYLSQIAAGQGSDSPCVDTGSDTASKLKMDNFWTRTDEATDTGTVDMGFHYGPATTLSPSVATLIIDVMEISATAGGISNFTLKAGASYAGRKYLIFGSISGTAPGFPLPGGSATVPINWDAFTDLVLSLVNTPVFASFAGTLDSSGQAFAQLTTGPIPGFSGINMYYAYCLGWPWEFASNPVFIAIVP